MSFTALEDRIGFSGGNGGVCLCLCVCDWEVTHTHTQAPYGDNDNYEESEIVVVGHYCRWLNTAPLQTHYRVTH